MLIGYFFSADRLFLGCGSPPVRTLTPTLACVPQPSPLSAAHTAGCPGAVSAPLLHQIPLVPFPQLSSGIDRQQHPAFSKQLITRNCSCLHPHFANFSVQRHFPHVWLLDISALPLPAFFGLLA